ncbi:BMP family ABC transporter substrate-binding protein [Treponema primitia]|uniref:BMP family ABC transporter substrate-binding protein n=1 Tax=Treponema primitia TaxID=88058 RepID=UPI000255539C|nr:BMP family ABC transporter substrate-binding protein [Treponema primitia]
MKKILLLGMAVCMAAGLSLASCSGKKQESGANAAGSAKPVGIGFIFVGARDDYGYNQAAYQGSVAVEQAFGDRVKIYRSENVPETSEASRVLEQMIQVGATVQFPTSYGHLDPALDVAKNRKDVIFFHQGGLKTSDNLGTYFGTIWEPFYLAGMAAGKVTKTNKLGFIASFPIPQVLLNINAFELGAKSVNPAVTTTVVFTGSWADPAMQTNAANSLIDGGADVLTQHQDSTKTIIEICERRGVKAVGNHADASELAPEGWVTGAMWNWGPTFIDMAQTALDGKFTGSKYDGKFRGGLKEGVVDLAPFGKNVPPDVVVLVNNAKAQMIAGDLFAFEGEVKDQTGKVVIAKGARPSVDELETCDYLVEGVIGSVAN